MWPKINYIEVTEEEYQSSDNSCIYMYEFVVYIICKGLYSSCIQYLIHSTHFSHAILVGCERQNYSKRKRCKTRRVRRRIRTNIRMRWRWSRTLLNSQLFSCPVQLIDSKLHCVIEQHDQTISSYCFYLTTSPFSFFFVSLSSSTPFSSMCTFFLFAFSDALHFIATRVKIGQIILKLRVP